MENTICLDSDFLIDFLRNKGEAVKWIKENFNKNIYTTSINIFEVLYGVYKLNKKSELKQCKEFLDNLHVINLTRESAEFAVDIMIKLEKQGDILDFKDIVIASMVLRDGMALKTNNIKHFNRIPELVLV